MQQILECIPNFSEGRNKKVIEQITDEIKSVKDVMLLHVDSGVAANRTVVTFAGEPNAVVEAAFLAMKKAKELINMSTQKGEHPRIGATDVCPLVPISGITMEETIELAHQLGKRVGEELDYPVYFYESAAILSKRKNLAFVRKGEYEGLEKRLHTEVPDVGKAVFRPKTGATAIGARDFLIAVNFNLNTKSVEKANQIAAQVRESGKIIRDGNGQKVRQKGACKGTKAIGWYIEEYGFAQVSMNITNMNATALHTAYEEVSKIAQEQGVEVIGTEIIGLVPLKAMTLAGKHFLEKQKKTTDVPESKLIQTAISTMNLNNIKPFHPEEKVIELRMRKLAKYSLC